MTAIELCILGDSHLAALRSAWAETPEAWPGLNITMIGAPHERLRDTEVTATHLRATSAASREAFLRFGGREEILLDDYDAFAVVGGRLSLMRLVSLHFEAAWPDLPSFSKVNPDTDERRLISNTAARAVLAGTLSDSAAVRLATALRQRAAAPVVVVPQPRPSRESRRARSFPKLRMAVNAGDGAAMSRMFDGVADTLCAERALTYLRQPRATLSSHVYTDAAFMAGSLRLAPTPEDPHPKDDYLHANAEYGRLVLDRIAARIRDLVLF